MNPTTQPQQEAAPSDFDRYMALKLLRENMFYSNPEKYSLTDVAEDLPGAAKPLGHMLKNVLPTATIFSHDPEERKAQLQQAIARIKASAGNKQNLKDEMVHNAITMGKASILPALAFTVLPKLLGLRGIRGGGLKPGYAGGTHGVARHWQLPIAPVQALRKLFTSPTRAKVFGKEILSDTVAGSLIPAALSGAVYPWLAHDRQVSDKALAQAQQIMEQQPYITSLPTAEMMSAIQTAPGNEPSKAQNILTGTSIGGAMGAIGGTLPTALSFGLSALTGGKVKPRGGLLGPRAMKSLVDNIKMNAAFGAAGGALSGAKTKNYIEDQAHLNSPAREQAQNKPTPVAAVQPLSGNPEIYAQQESNTYQT